MRDSVTIRWLRRVAINGTLWWDAPYNAALEMALGNGLLYEHSVENEWHGYRITAAGQAALDAADNAEVPS